MTALPPLILDSFACGGGASTGVEMALGRSPDVAINHSAAALALHAANHPETLHHDARSPLSAIAATGSHQTPVAAFLAKYYGTAVGVGLDEPAHTVTAKPRFSHVQDDLAAPPFAPKHHARARQVADLLRAHGAWDGGEFVTMTVTGVEYVVVDIGMRMLTPRELFQAQGFPENYVIEGVWSDAGGVPEWRPFPKTVQVSCCGNSVCPPVAAAIVAANCGHLAISAAPDEVAL